MRTSETTKQLFEALRDARAEFPDIEKNAENPFFKSKYADYNSVRSAVDPVLAQHNLFVLDVPDAIGDQPALTITLRHLTSDEFVESTTPLSLSKKDPQAHGSALTYMKRYALVTILGLKNAESDDDGNIASQPDTKVTSRGKVADDKAPSREAMTQKQGLEALAAERGWSKGKLAKWYHDEFGKDYKSDTDDMNLSKAMTKLAGLTA